MSDVVATEHACEGCGAPASSRVALLDPDGSRIVETMLCPPHRDEMVATLIPTYRGGAATYVVEDLNPSAAMPPASDPEIAIMPGACLNNMAALADMHKQARLGLIERNLAAGKKLGPVQFEHWHTRLPCRSALRMLYADDDRLYTRFGLDQLEAFFDEHPDDCVLVVARAEVLS